MTFPTWSVGEVLTAADMNAIGQYITYPRNLLYNGAMQVAQRSSNVPSITTSNYYTADRWQMQGGAGTWTQSIENDAPTGSGFRKSFKMLCTAQKSPLDPINLWMVRQPLEGQDLQSIRKGTSSAQQLTVSFWVKSNVTGTYVFALFDNDNNRVCARTYSISASATWEFKTITFPADTTGAFDNDNGASLYAVFHLLAGTQYSSGTLQTTWGTFVDANYAVGQVNVAAATNNYWQVTGVQLNVGSVAAPFEFKSYQQELRECQRYYWRTGGTAFGPIGIANTQSTTAGRVYIKLPVTMRRDPTGLTMIGSAANVGTGTFTSLTHDRATTDALMASLVGTGFTAGGAQMIYGAADATTFLEVTGAEL